MNTTSQKTKKSMSLITKKVLITIVVACLGVAAGTYTAQNFNTISDLFKKKKEPPKTWEVQHPNWNGNFILEGENRVYLTATGDYATIVSDKDGVLTVKWDNWGTESFQCDAARKCTLEK